MQKYDSYKQSEEIFPADAEMVTYNSLLYMVNMIRRCNSECNPSQPIMKDNACSGVVTQDQLSVKSGSESFT